jgi:hypothetical protein
MENIEDCDNTGKLEFKPPFLLVLNGCQGSGKSTLIKWIMRENSLSKTPFSFGIVFTNTAFEGSFPYIPKKYIYENFDENVLKNLMNIQKNNVKKGIHKEAFVILDDCLDDEKQWESPALKKLSTQLRHYNISLIITTQYCHLIKPRFRSNAMYSVFFDCGPGRRETEAIFNAYGARFKNFEEFKRFYYANTKDYKFVSYNKETDSYQTYKCPSEIPDFKIKYNRKIKSQ